MIRQSPTRPRARCTLQFTESASEAFDAIKDSGHLCYDRLCITLGCLEGGIKYHPSLVSRKWTSKTSYNPKTQVFESFIPHSKPDYYVIWHYKTFRKENIVILLIDIP